MNILVFLELSLFIHEGKDQNTSCSAHHGEPLLLVLKNYMQNFGYFSGLGNVAFSGLGNANFLLQCSVIKVGIGMSLHSINRTIFGLKRRQKCSVTLIGMSHYSINWPNLWRIFKPLAN